jgi:NAD(P)-dependent dehydrogenase (short-subunit alcohol dehydrogenase family)
MGVFSYIMTGELTCLFVSFQIQATAKAFAIAGAKTIIITGRRLDALEDAATAIKTAANGKTAVLPITVDVTSKASVDALWVQLAKEVGKIDVLVNNAGILAGAVAIGNGHVEEWWNVQVIPPPPILVLTLFLFVKKRLTWHGPTL